MMRGWPCRLHMRRWPRICSALSAPRAPPRRALRAGSRPLPSFRGSDPLQVFGRGWEAGGSDLCRSDSVPSTGSRGVGGCGMCFGFGSSTRASSGLQHTNSLPRSNRLASAAHHL